MAEIAELDPPSATGERFEQVHAVLAACHAETARREPYRNAADTRAYLLHPPAGDERLQWIGLVDGVAAGVAQLSSLRGSRAGSLQIHVRPDARRRGIARSLLEAVVAHAHDAGLESLSGHHATPAGARFAARAGFVDGRRYVRSTLALGEAHLASEPVTGYSLRRWEGAAPSELLESYAVVREAINDEPGSTDDDWEPYDAARVRELEEAVARRGRQIRVTAALGAAGDVAAFTELRVGTPAGSLASIEDTAVLPAHRRRGLGRWVKTDSLASLREARPDVSLVATKNAEPNAGIRDLNAALGFEVESVSTTCVLRLRRRAGT
jgi:ribosomal protein S18 acetylase RimI-like enzyme